MNIIWRYKLYLVLFVLGFCAYMTAPTVIGLKKIKAEYAKQEKNLPWYYSFLPNKELNLGLDLRGGIYLEMLVDMDEAITHYMENKVSDVNRYVFKNNLKNGSASYVSDELIRVRVPNQKNIIEVQRDITNALSGEGFEFETDLNEIFLSSKAPLDTLRKALLKDLQPVAQNFEVRITSDKKFLAIYSENDATVTKIQNFISQNQKYVGALQLENPNQFFYIVPNDEMISQIQKDIIDQAGNSVRNRIDRYGVAEANVSRSQDSRLVVELPGLKDPKEVIAIIKKTGQLEFRLVDETVSEIQLSALINAQKAKLKLETTYQKEDLKKINEALKADLPQGTVVAYELKRDPKTKKVINAMPYAIKKEAQVTGDMLENARIERNQQGRPLVSLSLNKLGTRKFGEVTKNNVNKRLAIVLDDVVIQAPNINEAILSGQAQITLGSLYADNKEVLAEAKELVMILKEGALPATLSVGTKNVIGPSLGQDSIDAGMRSILISGILVLLFMVIYYRRAGVVADVALIINVFIIIAALCTLQASLTLPGMAGIVLTLGMAVDANVIIFERMREEQAKGKDILDTVELGFNNAFSAILDGNITTFIAGLVLFEFGTGPIKGFATTLMIGIFCTLFSAYFVTRLIYDWMVGSLKIKKIGF